MGHVMYTRGGSRGDGEDGEDVFILRSGACFNDAKDWWEQRYPDTSSRSLCSSGGVAAYAKVISIAAYWCEGFWHFVGECFMGLSALTAADFEGAYVHVREVNGFVKEMLFDFFGVPAERIVGGESVHAEQVIVPVIAMCGNPSPYQLFWFRALLLGRAR